MNRGVRDGQLEVLADFVFVEDLAELHADRRGPASAPRATRSRILSSSRLVASKQRLALMRSKLRELRITAGDEPLIGKLRIRELKEIAFIEEPQLQRAACDEAADLAALQSGDPRQPVDA